MPRRAYRAVWGALLAFGLLLHPDADAAPSVPIPSAAVAEPGASEHTESRAEAPAIPVGRPSVIAGELRTPRFVLAYTAHAEGAARALSADIERIRDEFSHTLGRDWPGVTELRIGVGRDEYEALALPGGRPPKWSVALAYPTHGIVLLDALSLNSPQGPQTLRHELSHVALGRLGNAWPRWFQEGLAMHLSGERYRVSQYAALFRAVTQDRLYRFGALADGWPEAPGDVEVAYAQSLSFVEELLALHGPGGMSALVDEMKRGDAFETAFARALQTSLTVEEERWRRELPRRYSWWPLATAGTTVMGGAALLSIAAFIRRRRQLHRALEEMTVREAAEEAARRIAEAEALREQEQLLLATPPDSDAPTKPTLH